MDALPNPAKSAKCSESLNNCSIVTVKSKLEPTNEDEGSCDGNKDVKQGNDDENINPNDHSKYP